MFCLLGTSFGARLLSPLRHAGRMALTNYLGASVLGTLYFSGYGLGHYMQVSRAGQGLFVAVVFAAQLAFSALWSVSFIRYLFQTLYSFLIDPHTARRAWFEGIAFPGLLSMGVMALAVLRLTPFSGSAALSPGLDGVSN